MSTVPHFRAGFVLTLSLAAVTAGAPRPAAAARPTAPRMLPSATVAYIRVADVPELREKLKATSMGRIGDDEKIKPLVSQLYGSAVTAFQQLQDQVGAGLDELLAIPQGEFCVALVVTPQDRLAVVGVIEAGDRLPTAQKVLTRGQEFLIQRGATKTQEAVGDTLVVTHEMPDDRQRRVVHFVREGTIVIGSDGDVIKQMLAAWNGDEKVTTLAQNEKFTAIMKRCGGSEDERPQLSFFVDPIELVKKAVRGGAAATTLALVPVLGLDGIQGVGGSLILATPEFDSIAHVHLLLDSPRTGIPAILALRSGDTTPEPFIPADAASYLTFHWDVGPSYEALAKVYNSFRGENALAKDAQQRIGEPLGLDFDKELLQALEGRVSACAWYVRPVRLNSRSVLLAAKLKDTAKARETLDRTMARFEQRWEKAAFGGVTYYVLKQRRNASQDAPPKPQAKPQPKQPPMDPRLLRQPAPCVAILDDYLVITDSSEFLHHAVLTQSDASQALSSQLEFKLIAAKVRRQPGGEFPALIAFNRPEEPMRWMYDLATADAVREQVGQRADGSRFFGAVNSALKDNPLPPFSVLSQHLAPGGGLLTSDETGLHFVGFGLKRE